VSLEPERGRMTYYGLCSALPTDVVRDMFFRVRVISAHGIGMGQPEGTEQDLPLRDGEHRELEREH
jgi:hypothetical protein